MGLVLLYTLMYSQFRCRDVGGREGEREVERGRGERDEEWEGRGERGMRERDKEWEGRGERGREGENEMKSGGRWRGERGGGRDLLYLYTFSIYNVCIAQFLPQYILTRYYVSGVG